MKNHNKTGRKCTVKLKFVSIHFHVLDDSKIYHAITFEINTITITNCAMNVQHKAFFFCLISKVIDYLALMFHKVDNLYSSNFTCRVSCFKNRRKY